MADKELLEALHKMEQTMDRLGKIQYLAMIHQQEIEKNKIPTSLVFGSQNFNPFSDGTRLAQWMQIAPRNTRRRAIKIMPPTTGSLIYLAISDTKVSINSVIAFDNSTESGNLNIMLANLSIPLELQTSESVWACSLTGTGSVIEKKSSIGWAEEIYSDISAIPFDNHDVALNRQGRVANMTSGLMSLDEDERNSFTREGVR